MARGRLETAPPAPGEEGGRAARGRAEQKQRDGAAGVSVCADDRPRNSGLPSHPPSHHYLLMLHVHRGPPKCGQRPDSCPPSPKPSRPIAPSLSHCLTLAIFLQFIQFHVTLCKPSVHKALLQA